jgi:hypothetical protein
MRRCPQSLILATLLIAAFLSSSAQTAAQTGRVESLPALTGKSVPEPVRQILDAKGYRILLDDGTPACELWLRASVPVQAKQDIQGVAYPQLSESTLVGVINFPQASADYRGQAIPAGFYTLRYALLPIDGNHLGTAPTRDFLLLIPASDDGDPKASLEFQELVNLSRKATATKHPGPLSLVQSEGTGTAPAVSKDDDDHWIFSGGMKLLSGDVLPFALVVKGTAQQ